MHYHFISKEEFQREIQEKNFLEHNEVHGNYYGTHLSQLETIQDLGKIAILDIDVKGAQDISKNDHAYLECNFVFV